MHVERVTVSGMTCSGCITAVTHALETVGGVSAVNVSFETGEATVQYDERLTSMEALRDALRGAGYGVVAVGPDKASVRA
jgi:copper chaperone CopZ